MKSAWVVQRGKIEIREEKYVPPEADEVVVRIIACGICETDLHFYRDFPGNAPIPLAVDSGARRVVVLGKGFETERGRRRKEAAQELGADAVVDTDRKEWIEQVKAEVPEGFEKIIVTSPPRSIPPTFELAAFGADIIFNGISFRDEEITFNANSFHFNKLALIASHAIPNWGFPQALEMLAEMKPECRQLITHRFPFEKSHEALRIAGSKDQGVIKVMVTFE